MNALRLEKTVTLKNGRELHLRSMNRDDAERSREFFRALPAEDRSYLRGDVNRRDFVSGRIRDMALGRVQRIVVLDGGRIVGDGALELTGHEWDKHVGELRVIVAKDYQRQGLGTLIARELYILANQEQLEEIVVRMMRPSDTVRSIFLRFGFDDEIVLPGFVKDASGRRQDLILMRCQLSQLWDRMEEYLREGDWERNR